MKNLQISLLMLITLASVSLFAAEAPPKPTTKETASFFERLPAELQGEIRNYALKGMQYPDIGALANSIIAMQDRNSAQSLIKIFESLPYIANAIDLSEKLHGLKIMKNPEIIAWTSTAKKRLELGEELYEAVLDNSSQKFEDALKNKNINLNWQNEADGFSPLMNAVYNNRIPMMKALLQAGANPNLQDSIGETALFKEALFLRPEVLRPEENIKLLLAAGSNPNIKNEDGDTAYDLAVRYKRFNNAKLLKEAMAKTKMEK